MTSRKKDAKGDTPKPQPQATPEERARVVKELVGQLNARPDAQARIISDTLPVLNRLFNVDIPQVDLNPREHATAPMPGPMTQNRIIDPVKVDASSGPTAALVNPPAGGGEAKTIVAVGKALGPSKGRPLAEVENRTVVGKGKRKASPRVPGSKKVGQTKAKK